MYKAEEVADYIVCFLKLKRRKVDQFKISCLLYFIQAYFMNTTNEPCFEDKMIAWGICAVVPDIYYKYKGSEIGVERKKYSFSEKDQKRIDNVLNTLVKYSTESLIRAVMRQDAFKIARRFHRDRELSLSFMRDYPLSN